MPFDPPPTSFTALQEAYHRLMLERDDLHRKVQRLTSDISFLQDQVIDLQSQLSNARGEW